MHVIKLTLETHPKVACGRNRVRGKNARLDADTCWVRIPGGRAHAHCLLHPAFLL